MPAALAAPLASLFTLAVALSACVPLSPAASPAETAQSIFDARFTGRTLRFDYYHTGTASEEHWSLDQVRLEGEWPGSRTRLLDDTNLGKYLFVVTDLATQQPLYSRGFASIYGEWETTGEARKGVWRTFHESQRFPEPRCRCQVAIRKRANDGSFREVFATVVDPADRSVDRSPVTPRGEVWTLFESGPPSQKLDLLVLGDGYTAAEREKLHADVARLAGALFDTEPFRSRRGDFNVRAVDVASARAGITDPRGGVWNDTPLGLSFNAFDSDRYVLTYRNRELREVAALAPHDTIIILANTDKYGGGGIFNLWATCVADSSQSAYIFVHELGHSLAGLADEYYTSPVSYEEFTPAGVEPWEPNITALLEPQALKWKDLVGASTPVPTPWNQEAYDKVAREYQRRRDELTARGAPKAEMEQLFDEVKAATTPMLRGEKFFGQVGAFEGAGYQAKGLYRPEADCMMFTRNPQAFCKVCARAIERAIDLYAK
jgi:hypothetical protein